MPRWRVEKGSGVALALGNVTNGESSKNGAPSSAVGVGMILAVVFGFMASIFQQERQAKSVEKHTEVIQQLVGEIHDMNAQNRMNTESIRLQYPPEEWREMREGIKEIKRRVGAR